MWLKFIKPACDALKFKRFLVILIEMTAKYGKYFSLQAKEGGGGYPFDTSPCRKTW